MAKNYVHVKYEPDRKSGGLCLFGKSKTNLITMAILISSLRFGKTGMILVATLPKTSTRKSNNCSCLIGTPTYVPKDYISFSLTFKNAIFTVGWLMGGNFF